jgi:magnesium transporter
MANNRKNKNRSFRPDNTGSASKVGMAPGSLVHLGERKTQQTTLTLTEYDDDELMESHLATLTDTPTEAARLSVTWLNVHGLHDAELMAAIGRRFGLHPLVLEDIMNTHQRPKVDDYEDYLFLVAHFFEIDEQTGEMSSDQVSLVLGRGFVLSFQERPSGRFDPVRDRLRHNRGQIRKLGADYLAYSLLDAIVDRYFAVLENIGERTDELEDQMLERHQPQALQAIHRLKRETLQLRRSVWPLREVISALTHAEDRFFQAATRPYLRDVYDHTVHVIESLEANRDVIAGMLDLYLSSVSNRVNQEVRALTVAAVIFMPATLIAGIFGMNFKSMPLLENPLGFYEATGVMALVAGTLSVLFWRLRWLK